MRAIVTVIGKDRVGIIADVCAVLAKNKVNVLDISQTVMQDYFTMIMMVDAGDCPVNRGVFFGGASQVSESTVRVWEAQSPDGSTEMGRERK